MLEIDTCGPWHFVSDDAKLIAYFGSKEDAELFVRVKESVTEPSIRETNERIDNGTTGQWPCGCPVEPLITHMENTSSPYIENGVPLGWIGNGSPYFELNGPVDESVPCMGSREWYVATFNREPEPDDLPEPDAIVDTGGES